MILLNDETNKREILINPEHIVCAVREHGGGTRIFVTPNSDIKSFLASNMDIITLAKTMNEWYAAVHDNKPS